MKYIVIEVQKYDNGAIGIVPPVTYDTRESADSKFYTILAAAALSGLPKHGAMIFSENCKLIMSKLYDREQATNPDEMPLEDNI